MEMLNRKNFFSSKNFASNNDMLIVSFMSTMIFFFKSRNKIFFKQVFKNVGLNWRIFNE